MKINVRTICVFVFAIVGASLVLNGCSPGTTSGKPYADLEDLKNRGVLVSGFSKTWFELGSDNTIELRFNTFGRPKDQKLIDPAMERVKYLMQNLRKQHPVHLVVI